MMKQSVITLAFLTCVAAVADVIEYKGDFPEMDAGAFAALTNKIVAGDTLLVLSEKAPKEFAWKTDGPDRLLSWPRTLKLEKGQRDRVTWRKLGRGLIISAPETVDSADFRTNISWHADLLRNHGFWYVGYSTSGRDSSFWPVLGATFRYAERKVEEKKSAPAAAGYWANYDRERTRGLRPLYRLEGKVAAADGEIHNYETIEQPFGETVSIGNVWMNKNFVHGKARLETYFHDITDNFSVLIDSREWTFPDYLDVFLPNNGVIGVNRDTADVTIGVRINDEPHFEKDIVKVTLVGFDGRPLCEKQVEVPVGRTIYADLPVPREALHNQSMVVRFETKQADGRIVKAERRFRLNNDARYDMLDQDGMLLKKCSTRSFRFGESSSVTNFYGTKIIATWKFGESHAMTHALAEDVLEARQAAGPLAPLAVQVAMDATSSDRASDTRAIKAIAGLAFIGGANAVDWDFSKCKSMLNPLSSHALEAQKWYLALDPAFAAKGHCVTSTDGALYARVTKDTLLIVNTERFEAHESILKVSAFAGKTFVATDDGTKYTFDAKGCLRLKLEPDAVLAIRSAE